ncbi:MAG: WbuC family cupin fold metalloprotein [Candidatus Obscuribacterales bacterium]|nr:WbuC family cupin fold metalloprotein [Candidatus Obscuribacterales bacterium]
MRIRKQNEEVFFIEDPIVNVDKESVHVLIDRIGQSKTGRVRLCAHSDLSEPIHEMLILLSRNTYVRPHKHEGKVESFHIVYGQADVVIFDENGNVTDLIKMGDFGSGKTFFYRLSSPRFHTVLVRSELVLIHETTNGPFDKRDTIYAPWSPAEDEEGGEQYKADLDRELLERSD